MTHTDPSAHARIAAGYQRGVSLRSLGAALTWLWRWRQRRRSARIRAAYALGRASMSEDPTIRDAARMALADATEAHAWLGKRCQRCGLGIFHADSNGPCVPSEPR